MMFQRLKSYFCLQEQCSAAIKSFFEGPCREMYLHSVCGQGHLFNDADLKIEKTSITTTEVAWEVKQSLEDREKQQVYSAGSKIIVL